MKIEPKRIYLPVAVVGSILGAVVFVVITFNNLRNEVDRTKEDYDRLEQRMTVFETTYRQDITAIGKSVELLNQNMVKFETKLDILLGDSSKKN